MKACNCPLGECVGLRKLPETAYCRHLREDFQPYQRVGVHFGFPHDSCPDPARCSCNCRTCMQERGGVYVFRLKWNQEPKHFGNKKVEP